MSDLACWRQSTFAAEDNPFVPAEFSLEIKTTPSSVRKFAMEMVLPPLDLHATEQAAFVSSLRFAVAVPSPSGRLGISLDIYRKFDLIAEDHCWVLRSEIEVAALDRAGRFES